MRLARTGPISPTPCKNKLKAKVVPMMTNPAMARIDMKSQVME